MSLLMLRRNIGRLDQLGKTTGWRHLADRVAAHLPRRRCVIAGTPKSVPQSSSPPMIDTCDWLIGGVCSSPEREVTVARNLGWVMHTLQPSTGAEVAGIRPARRDMECNVPLTPRHAPDPLPPCSLLITDPLLVRVSCLNSARPLYSHPPANSRQDACPHWRPKCRCLAPIPCLTQSTEPRRRDSGQSCSLVKGVSCRYEGFIQAPRYVDMFMQYRQAEGKIGLGSRVVCGPT